MNKIQKISSITLILLILDKLVKIIYINLDKKIVWNSGTFFGTLKGNNFLFIILSILVIVAILYLLKESKPIKIIPLVLILAGVSSNFLERIFFGKIIDVIYLPSLPHFNLADVYILTGLILIIKNNLKNFRH